MNNKIKKILAVFLILSLINGMFAFADEKFVSNMNIVEIKNEKTGEILSNFSIGDMIKTEEDGVIFDYNKKLKINIFKESEFKLNNFNLGELINGQVEVSSIGNYSINIGNIKINLKDSGIIVYKDKSEIKILSQYGINKIFFNGEEIFLLAGNQAVISGEKIIFTKKDVKNNNKIFLEDRESKYYTPGGEKIISKLLSGLIVFENKKNDVISFEEKNIFNECIESISELTEKEKEGFNNIKRIYKKVEEKCINDKILKNKKFAEKFEENFENISSLKEKFFINEKRKNFLGEKFSFIEKIFYLQKNISSGDLKNFSYFLDESKKSFYEEKDLKNLEIGFILIDGILKNNLKFSFEKIYDFRNKISKKVLAIISENDSKNNSDKSGKKLISSIKKNISINLQFIEKLLKNKNYKELDYIFANKIVYENLNNNKELAVILDEYNKTLNNYLNILDSSKNILHGSAGKNNEKNDIEKSLEIESIKKAEKEKEEKEKEIKAMLDSFKVEKNKEVKITSREKKIEIIKIFKKYGFSVKGENIEGFMEGGNVFYVNGVKFLEKEYDLIFDLNNNIVSKIKSLKDSNNGDKFDGTGSMKISRFKNLVSVSNFKASSFDARPSNVFQNLEEKDFSHEGFLKKELVRKYLSSVGVKVESDNILRIIKNNENGEYFEIKNSKIEKYGDLNIGFKLKLIEWSVSDINFGENFGEKNKNKYKDSKNLEKNIKKIKLAKNLKSKIEIFYGNYLLRNENLIKVLSNLAGLGIKKADIFLGEDDIDGFNVYKGLEMSSGNGILSGKYFVGKNIFTNAKFTLGEYSEDYKDISVSDLIEKIKIINKNINDLEKLKSEEELAKIRENERLEKIRILNYGNNIPDELLDGDWITD